MLKIDDIKSVLDDLGSKTRQGAVRLQVDADAGSEALGIELVRESTRSFAITPFVARLSRCIIRLRFVEVEGAPNVALLRVDSLAKVPLAEWVVREGSRGWPKVASLLEDVNAKCDGITIDQLLEDTGEVAEPTEALLGDDTSREFLRFVAGEWQVTMDTQGSGSPPAALKIDREGKYYSREGRRASFILRDVHYDPIQKTVSFAKVAGACLPRGLWQE